MNEKNNYRIVWPRAIALISMATALVSFTMFCVFFAVLVFAELDAILTGYILAISLLSCMVSVWAGVVAVLADWARN